MPPGHEAFDGGLGAQHHQALDVDDADPGGIRARPRQLRVARSPSTSCCMWPACWQADMRPPLLPPPMFSNTVANLHPSSVSCSHARVAAAGGSTGARLCRLVVLSTRHGFHRSANQRKSCFSAVLAPPKRQVSSVVTDMIGWVIAEAKVFVWRCTLCWVKTCRWSVQSSADPDVTQSVSDMTGHGGNNPLSRSEHNGTFSLTTAGQALAW
jgi:hypothetical protein